MLARDGPKAEFPGTGRPRLPFLDAARADRLAEWPAGLIGYPGDPCVKRRAAPTRDTRPPGGRASLDDRGVPQHDEAAAFDAIGPGSRWPLRGSATARTVAGSAMRGANTRSCALPGAVRLRPAVAPADDRVADPDRDVDLRVRRRPQADLARSRRSRTPVWAPAARWRAARGGGVRRRGRGPARSGRRPPRSAGPLVGALTGATSCSRTRNRHRGDARDRQEPAPVRPTGPVPESSSRTACSSSRVRPTVERSIVGIATAPAAAGSRRAGPARR